jgi:16S rRNA (cytosine1402-N4)-methyltransferase
MEQPYHIPVLLHETIDLLQVAQRPGGVFVDCTFGGGGHSKAILQQLNAEGRLYVFDQDEDAKQNLPDDSRVVFIHQNFRHIQRMLRLHGVKQVDGLLADLGVSSHQFDEAERGFSIRFDAPLDMRMDNREAKTAADILMQYAEPQLHKLFEQYGEVTNSKTLARTIVQARKHTPLRTIDVFKKIVGPIVKGNPNRYFAQVFQALRIGVNEEMTVLKELLEQLPSLLSTGGRAAIITFHSLEDRLVKNFFKQGGFELPNDNPFLQSLTKNPFKIITKKPVEASAGEQKQNPRSRSAGLRVAERAAD